MADTDIQDAKAAAIEHSMREQGIATEQKVPADYFGVDGFENVTLPDGVSYVTIRTLTEGHRRKYMNQVNRDVRFQKATGDAVMRMAPGDEKHTLLEMAIVGWNLKQGGTDAPFTPQNLQKFLENTSPRIIDIIDKAVRKLNDWLMADVTSADIQAEIDDLQEQLAKKLDEEAGKASS